MKPGDEDIVGIVVEFHRRADLLDDAVAQDHDAVGQGHRLDLVVGDVDHRRGQVAVKPGDLDAGGDPEGGVEVGERLVEEEELRGAHDGAADRDPLALAAGELRRAAVKERVERQHGRCFGGAPGDFGAGLTGLFQPEAHVVAHREMRIERVGLEYHRQFALRGRHAVDPDPVDLDVAGGGVLEAGDHPQQRRFSAARGADEDAELAVADLEIDAADDLGLSEGFRQIPQCECAHSGSPFRVSPARRSARSRPPRGRPAAIAPRPAGGG